MSSHEREERLDSLFETARTLPAGEREAFLRRECGDDVELADELRALLAVEPPSHFLVPPAAAPGVGNVFGTGLENKRLGRYRLIREIGRGGMGVVYLAERDGLERLCAVKILPSLNSGVAKNVAQFRSEPKYASRVEHPNVVPILDQGEDEGVEWYAMRYVDGHDLHQELVRQRRRLQGELDASTILPPFGTEAYVSKVLEVVLALLDALHHGHSLVPGVVHRDVKPQNVLLDRVGRPFLIDFGLARVERPGPVTTNGGVEGTPHYMSPEQARILNEKIDRRTDVYSVSVVLYEMLCLERAFHGTTPPEVLRRIATEEPRPLRACNPRVARDLAVICAKGMSKQPSGRYSTALDMADDLRRFLRHEAILAKPPSFLERARASAVRHATPLLVAAAAVFALAVGAWRATVHARDSARESRFVALRALPDESQWDTSSGAEVIDAHEFARSFVPNHAAPEQVRELEFARQRFARYRDTLLARIRALLDRGLGGRPLQGIDGPLVAGPSDYELAEARRLATFLALLHPEDAEVALLAREDATFARVSVSIADVSLREWPPSAGSTLHVHAIDPIEGVVQPVSRRSSLPAELRLAPGHYRFVVIAPDGEGFAELTRFVLASREAYELQARMRRTSDVVRGMKLVEAGSFDSGVAPSGGCSLLRERVDHAAFWIDEAELSNGEFVAYLEESGAPPPWRWREKLGYAGDARVLAGGMPLERWSSLPAAGLTWGEAQAAVEWRGGRLPTHVELERSHRGMQAVLRPSDVDGSDALANVGGEPKQNWSIARGEYDLYLRSVLPVRDERYRQAPEGLFHAYGNVSEHTETALVEVLDGMVHASPWKRVHLGGAWDAEREGLTLATHGWWGVGDAYATAFIGVRSAKSASP